MSARCHTADEGCAIIGSLPVPKQPIRTEDVPGDAAGGSMYEDVPDLPRHIPGTLALLWALYCGTPHVVGHGTYRGFGSWGGLMEERVEMEDEDWMLRHRWERPGKREMVETARSMFSTLSEELGVDVFTVGDLTKQCVMDLLPIPIESVQEQRQFLSWILRYQEALADVEHKDMCIRMLDMLTKRDFELVPINWEETIFQLTVDSWI
ncbi:hypothetical protein KIPB_005682 [Kipferlia bialata]|uniref:Uncharacterized protein n=1 Tax=Kipferlia bialata TaxID=797122 RepID=A0A9K3CYY5_9EUKA|nr:hypothetical protein KIPB_005682 [Kipferlia bialata]|eukprot:g5682.t1